MTQTLIVDGTPISDLHRYTIRFYSWHGAYDPVLYFDGKRVTKAWSLKMDVEVAEDVLSAGSVNTA